MSEENIKKNDVEERDSSESNDEEAETNVNDLEQVVTEIPQTQYSDEELIKLVEFIQRMTMLFALDHRDWTEDTLDVIRRWITEVNEPLLTLFYDCNKLTSCLGFPMVPIADLSYFSRSPNCIFTVEGFHDEINFGTIHEDVDFCLLKVLKFVYAPIFHNFTYWNETIRTRFSQAMDKILSYLTNLNSKMAGMTLLYIPYVVKQIANDNVAHDEDFVKNMENIMVFWNTQIRILLTDMVLVAPHDFLVLQDEFEFWIYRFEVLHGIQTQLEESDVKDIIKLLRASHSVYIKTIDELLTECRLKVEEAKSNIKYMYLLIEPCRQIESANSLAEVAGLLPRIIHFIRYVWLNSPFYNRKELITNLFIFLSNQIIRFCAAHTSVDVILQGHSRFGIKMCNMSIDLCLSYKVIYERMSEEFGSMPNTKAWDLDNAMIFNHIDAFIERLNNLSDICESMIVFGRLDENDEIPRPRFGGTNSGEFEKIAKDVEKEFLQLLETLKTDSKDLILNVHKNIWYQKIQKYRLIMRTLEETVQRLMCNAFQSVCNIEEAIEVLNATLFYSYRSSIRQTYSKMVSNLWTMFVDDLNNTVNMLREHGKAYESWLSYYTSKAVGYRINMKRLKWLRDRLKNCHWLPAVPEAANALAKFDAVNKDLQTTSRKIFDDWVKRYSSFTLHGRLDRSLLIRSEIKQGLLECNIDHLILDICQQAQHFERLGFQIPGVISKFCGKYPTLKFFYNSVINVCNNYNHILSVLSDEERKLFKALIKSCDRKISPGVIKLTWGGELSGAYITDCAKHTTKLHNSLHIYKRANVHICRICEQICDTQLIKFTQVNAVEFPEFEAQLSSFNRKTNDRILHIYDTIIHLLLSVFQQFQTVIKEMVTEWYNYVLQFDNMFAEALLICARNSLNNVYSSMRADGDIHPAPLIIITADIEDQRVTLKPDMKTINSIILNMYQRIIASLNSVPRISQMLRLPENLIYPTFADLMTKDTIIEETQDKIRLEIAYNIEEIDLFIKRWNFFKIIWETKNDEFIAGIQDTEQTADIFEQSIESYSIMAELVAAKDAIEIVYFLVINQTQLKNTLIDYIEKWQLVNINLLTKRCLSRVKNIYRYVKRNEKRMAIIPRTLKEGREATDLFNRLIVEAHIKQNKFPQIFDLFLILDKYQIEMSDSLKILIENLESTWENYLKKLGDTGNMLDDIKEEFKQNLMSQAEKFRNIMKEFFGDFIVKIPTSSQTNPKIALKYLKIIDSKMQDCFKFEENLINNLATFNINQPENFDLRKLAGEVHILNDIWKLILEWKNCWNEWRIGNFWNINIDIIEDKALTLYKEFNKISKKYYNWDMIIVTTKNLYGFRRTLPLLTALRNPSIHKRHWGRIRDLMQVEFNEYAPDFTLELIINLDFQVYSEGIQDIANAAKMEIQIEKGIKNIASTWEKQPLDMILHRDGIYKIQSADECISLLEEHMVLISTMKSSKFVEPFIILVDYWEKTLSYMAETLENSLLVQKKWLYLENIFLPEDICKQLPNETKRFNIVTEEFKTLMEKMFSKRSALQATHFRNPPFLLGRFHEIDIRLEIIQRALENYLETKRQLFPRFYFVSNNDLLEILGNNKRPYIVHIYLKKLFDNLVKLELKGVAKNLNYWQVMGMYADDGEYVQFLKVLYINGPSEIWLKMLDEYMQSVLREQLKLTRDSLRKLSGNREKWLQMWPGQLVNTASLIQWTTECTRSLIHCKTVNQRKPLRKLKRKQNNLLGKLSEISRKDLSKIMRLKVNTLITVEIHGRDVIERLYKNNCKDLSNFEWFSQLRFYWHLETESCVVKQTNTENMYGYEYIGNSGRLAITPLTDRCYITLTTALHLHKGGSPQGPAGTGKTETVKDLGKALGMWVIVTNCSESLDFKSIGKIFAGLTQTGGWGCFDEFNRINIKVLSVVAQQIFSILSALAAKQIEFLFNGQVIKIINTVGIFITMNPGYAGRTELPDNLKSMFRPISMMVPDNIMIAENTLYSAGFTNTRSLARKVCTLYELAKLQLSKQYHYDFGLRSMVTLLRYAGRKRMQLHEASDEEVVYLAMRDMNVTRLTANDLPLFNGIMSDIFPEVDVPLIDYSEFRDAIQDELKSLGLQLIPIAIVKVLELYETKNSRHSTMIIGDTNTAKSITWKCLQGAFIRMNRNKRSGWPAVVVYPINPKALNLPELYGEYNLATGEWLEGVLSSIMRVICADEDHTQKWLLFDGPVDPVWIENMNSVMDDNKLLTLVNSERITMPAQVSLLFETADLAVASPATVSRCGMVYNDYTDWGWRPYVKSWLTKQSPKEYVILIREYFEDILDKVLTFKHLNCKETVVTNELNTVISMCNLLEGFSTKQNGIVVGNKELLKIMSKIWFMFCLVWSIGATVDENGRNKIDTFIRELDSSFPVKETVYDYFVDPNQRSFLHWNSKLSNLWKYDEEAPFYKIIVPTVDTVRYEYLVSKFLQNSHPVLLVGDIGTGKTSIAYCVTESCDKSKYTIFSTNMTAQTTATGLQDSIQNRTEKRTKAHYTPIGGKTMVCFMDDFNMPAKDAYGSQPPLELIRQWIDYKYWFNRRNQQKIYVLNTVIMAAMGLPGGGRQVISPRTMSRFYLLNITLPAEEIITQIFATIIKQKLQTFSNEVRELWSTITAASIQLYRDLEAKMLPTPNKSHYLFNLRDISKVFQGLLRSNSQLQVKKFQFLRLWIHESFRVYSDRLVDETDLNWFQNKINDILGKYMEVTLHSLCPNKVFPIFGHFMSSEGFYEDLNFDKLLIYINDKMKEYNNSGKARVNLIIFKEAIEYITRIVRILSQPRGHILNIGISGSGRQVLIRLAAFILEMGVFQIEVTKRYKSQEFRGDLKVLYKLAGIKQKATVFVFSGEQVVEDAFLGIINNMLSTAEINLFKTDEFEELKAELKKPAKRANVQLTTEALYNFFIQRVRDNMHIAIVMSPIGSSLRSHLRQYPALINNTTPNWFRQWSQEALLEVAAKFLSEFKINESPPSKQNKSEQNRRSLIVSTETTLQREVASTFSIMHSNVREMSDVMLKEMKRQNYITSLNYLQLVRVYKELLKLKRMEISASANKIRNGLWKITDTQEQVSSMSKELRESSAQVKVLAMECEEFITIIEIQKAEVMEQKRTVDEEGITIKKEEMICINLAVTAKADLDVVLPMIDAAVKALDALNKKDVAEIKSYGRPPFKIEKVMEGVLILLGKEPNWENAKKVLSEATFLNDLKKFDRDNISDKTLKRISVYTRNSELVPEKLAVVSVACKSLMEWIIAIENYGKVYRIVAPKQEKLDNATRSLAEKQAMLAAASHRLDVLNVRLAELYRQFQEKTDLLNELKTREERLRSQLERAIILVESLAGEKERWRDTVAMLDAQFKNLPGDCLIATAFLSYLGPFDTRYRDILMDKWFTLIKEKQIPATADLKIIYFLVDAVTIREWNIQGLPADDFSTENGIIVTKGIHWPLIIDPQIQANTWLKNFEEKNDLKVIDFDQLDYLSILELALQNGNPVLLQNVGQSIDQSIYPILRKTYVMQNGQRVMKFNDKLISFHDNFRLYITTKMTNPHYPPEICSKTTIVNFALKRNGLHAQLLGIVVRKEKPALEEQKDELVRIIARNRRSLIDLDNEILRLLEETTGPLLDNYKLFATLQKARQAASLVKESLSTAEMTEIEIDAARQKYHPAAERATILFFVLMDMAKIDPMYVFSLAAYIFLYTQSIEKSSRDQILYERIENINHYHTTAVYKNTCRGLFEKHKLLFSIHMAAQILENAAMLVAEEYEFILKGGTVLDRADQQLNPASHWISEQCWDNITGLDKISGFRGIIDSFEHNSKAWEAWYTTPTPEMEDLVGEWNDKLNGFQKICVIRSLRPDRVQFCLTQFVVNALGSRFVEPPVLDLKVAFEESQPQIPLIFVLSPGVDPTQALLTLADQVQMSSKIYSLSMGQGQAPVATKMILDGIREGNWVFLANCHLSLCWMPTLDNIVATIQNMKTHENFRLWLSSSPHPNFPISILQTGIKITMEPPIGIKGNMQRLYSIVNEDNFNLAHEPRKYKRLLFSLCFFHTILLERKKFLQLGWNVVYSFNESDFEVSETLLLLYLNEYKETPWDALKYLIAGVNYGGHVTDDWDRRLLTTYINQYFSNEALHNPNFRLSSLADYFIPYNEDLGSYKEHIQQLPNFDKPEAFGQHFNADIASLIGESLRLISTLNALELQHVSAAGENGESKVLRLAQEIEESTPTEINYKQTTKLLRSNSTPLHIVLLQEIKRYNILLRNMKIHLRDLQKGIEGLVVMSTDLDEIFEAVNEGRVPDLWLSVYQSEKPLASWTRDLVFRIEHFETWIKTFKAPVLFWLSAFTFPTGFLTAVLQTSARSARTPIDELSWEFNMFAEDEAAASVIRDEGGVYVRGMFLEGAGWLRKAKCLTEPMPMELITPMPVIHFKPVEQLKKKTRGIYSCPAYYYPQRSGSFVIAVDLNSGNETADHWIKRSTALLLSLNN